VAGAGLAGTLALALIDLLLGGQLSMFFDLGFITLCLGLGVLPRRDASYAAAFVPPLVLIVTFALLGAARPEAVGHPDDGIIEAVIAGLTVHAAALAIGYALCLAALGLRLRDPLSPRTG